MVQKTMYYNAMRPTADSLDMLTRLGHALSDPTRTQILALLSNGPRYPLELAAELATTKQSISNHLACLRGCGLVVSESEGRRTHYRLASEKIKRTLLDLRNISLEIDPVTCGNSTKKDCC